MTTMRVRFVRDAYVRSAGGCGTQLEAAFRSGQVVDLPVASAQRWIRRGLALAQEVEAQAKDPIEAEAEAKDPIEAEAQAKDPIEAEAKPGRRRR